MGMSEVESSGPRARSTPGSETDASESDRIPGAPRAIYAPEFSELEIVEATRLVDALGRLREAEQHLAEASRQALGLSEQDMRALQFLVTLLGRGEVATPSMLAEHMNISPASTTKLLNRLERSRHVSRLIHPSDRRTFSIEVAPESEALTHRSGARQKGRRLLAALQLSHRDRLSITRFLEELADGIRQDSAQWQREEHETVDPPEGSTILEPREGQLPTTR